MDQSLRTEILARAKDVGRNRGNHLLTELLAGSLGTEKVRRVWRPRTVHSSVPIYQSSNTRLSSVVRKTSGKAGAGKIEQLLNTVAVSALNHVTIYQQIVTH
jgi:hypothetical protein